MVDLRAAQRRSVVQLQLQELIQLCYVHVICLAVRNVLDPAVRVLLL